MDQVKIGKFIASLRKEKNITQQALGEKIGVSFKTILKWENGRGMPEISLIKPLSQELGVSINELLIGEKITNNDISKIEKNIVNTLEYSSKKLNEKNNIIALVLLIFGFLIVITAIALFPSDSSWSSIYSVFGCIISLIGFSKLLKRLPYLIRVISNFSFFVVFVLLLLIIDFINVKLNRETPRFCLNKLTKDTIVVYETPFYNVYVDSKDGTFNVDKHVKISDIEDSI